MPEIEAGSELDRAVAEAIGTGTVHPEGSFSAALPVPFLPSTDLNAAFEAAEKVGLFACDSAYHDQLCLKECESSWLFEDEEGIVFANGDTPALAICAAILKLKEMGAG